MTANKPNLHLKHCALCGAEALLWSENSHNGVTSADYNCNCAGTQEYAAAYARDYYIRQNYLRFMAGLEEKDRRYFDQGLRPSAENLQALKAAAEFRPPKFVYLYGDPGRGKTHIAIMAARSVLLAGKSVRFVSESQLLDERRAAKFRDAVIDSLPNALLLDDIGKAAKPGDTYGALIHDLLEECDRADIGVFITSNHPPADVARRIALDEQNAAAIQSRLELGRVIRLTGQDHRTGSKA